MSLVERIGDVQERIEKACASSGRPARAVTLVAVTKSVSAPVIEQAYRAGLRVFGESRLQDALPKIELLPKDIEWHFIGALQSNKAKRAARAFDVIHTLERESQLDEIEKAGREVQGLIEVDIDNEQQKTGISPIALDKSLKLIKQCKNVRFRGLMTIGQMRAEPEESRPTFRRLAELGEGVGAEWLSMGMSSDFEVAIQEGSTHVRVGSAIFGERK